MTGFRECASPGCEKPTRSPRAKTCSEKCATDAYQAAYRLKHAERRRQQAADWRASHRDESRKYSAEWRAANPNAYREWAAQNTARLAAKDAAWRKANPDRVRAHINARRARLAEAPGDGIESVDWVEILDWADHRCVYCGTGGVLTQDHVVPLSAGGAHDVMNIVPACFSCNASKQAKPVELWAPGWTSPWWIISF